MLHDVLISVVNSQVDMEGESTRIELTTEGKYYEKAGARFITYKETEVSGLEGTTTVIKVESDQISVIRMGAVEAKQIYCTGKRYGCNYITPYGTFPLEIIPWTVKSNFDSIGGNILLEYDLEINGQPQSRNTLQIRIWRE